MSKRKNDIALELYDEPGWINIPALAASGAWCIVIIGKRQVGKTFGTLKYMLDEGKYFLYLRRTANELQAIAADPDLNPFTPLQKVGYDIGIQKAGKITYAIGTKRQVSEDKWALDKRVAVGMALPSIATVRGFDGSAFSDVVYDEFIPERIAAKRKAEGEAVLNAYVTICGNRELEGHPPLRLWLLANAFDISSPVLQELGLIEIISKMTRTNREYIMTDTGVLVCMPHSDNVTSKRKQTALMKHLAGKGDFYQMAMENKFVYNNLENVRPRALNGMKPLFDFCGLYVYQMDATHYYVCNSPHQQHEHYKDTPQGSLLLETNHPEFRAMCMLGQVDFETIAALLKTRTYLDIDDK